MRIVVVEDQPEVGELVTRALVKDDHLVTWTRTAAETRAHLAEHEADALVLDLGLPDESGLSLCRALRAEGHTFPILVLTARSDVGTRVAGLDAGADDFLGKPFAVAELRARLRALGRRGPLRAPSEARRGEVSLDFGARRATVSGREAPLTAREWSVLELLVSRRGRVVSRADILESLWGDDTAESRASLEVIVGRVRRKLDPELVRTLRGEGYAADLDP